MTLRHMLPTLFVVAGLLASAPAALAATSAQVLADWRADGSIDGTYTLAELRAADSQINPQEREYTFWDETYADAVRRLSDPDAPVTERPPTVPPQDFDKDGDIDKKDIAIARKKTAELRAKAEESDEHDDGHQADEIEADSSASSSDDDEDGVGWLSALLFLVPAAVIGVGVLRMQRSRRAGKGVKPEDADAPSNESEDDIES